MSLDRVTTLFPRRTGRGAVAALPAAANDTTVARADDANDDAAFTIEVALLRAIIEAASLLWRIAVHFQALPVMPGALSGRGR